ncbi:Ubiquitin-conjugating enzyme E2 S [Armadillidium nasatum]|uniref:Ubiquitin-conjugating enzyme E2 S n=1 Tax=Armadillidium nasatum TaxID=96803 RepID=A0A5N5SMX1_9CRUS|nr:Ubiquitin-conjugating enzyme E2 S [Armadillidium nasatum]
MASTSNVENISPQTLRGVLKEMTDLVKNPPEGIKVILNDQDVTDIQATITGPAGTPYANGQFKIKLALGKDFPASPPKGYFITKIFHPNVASNGEICVNTLKKDWKPNLGIRHVFLAPKVQKTDKLEDLDDEPQSKKHATDKKMMERKKILKEKKRALKRL